VEPSSSPLDPPRLCAASPPLPEPNKTKSTPIKQSDSAAGRRCTRPSMQQGDNATGASVQQGIEGSHRVTPLFGHHVVSLTCRHLAVELEKGMRPGLRTTAPARCPVAPAKEQRWEGKLPCTTRPPSCARAEEEGDEAKPQLAPHQPCAPPPLRGAPPAPTCIQIET
jgi:hypothetical protein